MITDQPGVSPGEPPAVAIDQLRKRYRTGFFRPPVDALQGVSFEVGRGEIFGLLGPNGAGKTTIIKILLGIVRRSAGKARLLGYPAGDRRGRNQVGYLPENLRLPRHQTARTALELFGRLSHMRKSSIAVRGAELLQSVGLDGRDRESVRRFSKGMMQRLGLAQALLHDPQLLILDEPTDGLDPVGRSQVRTLLVEMKEQGRTIFLNSHLLQEVELVCDRVAILDRGQLKYVGTIDELTPSDEGVVTLQLTGDRSTIDDCLPAATVEARGNGDDDGFDVTLSVDHQGQIDTAVDTLRGRGVSIRALHWQRKTLEDAFLELVSGDTPQ